METREMDADQCRLLRRNIRSAQSKISNAGQDRDRAYRDLNALRRRRSEVGEKIGDLQFLHGGLALGSGIPGPVGQAASGGEVSVSVRLSVLQ